MTNDLTTKPLSNFAQDKGFDSEEERLKLIFAVPQYKYAELERWMDTCGTKEGLLKILSAKRQVQREHPADAAMDAYYGSTGISPEDLR